VGEFDVINAANKLQTTPRFLLWNAVRFIDYRGW